LVRSWFAEICNQQLLSRQSAPGRSLPIESNPVVIDTKARRMGSREGRTFGLTLAIGFLAVGLLAASHERRTFATICAALSVIWLVCGLVIPQQLGPAKRIWAGVGDAMARVTTPIFLLLVYFAVLTPLALIRRMTAGRTPAKVSEWHLRPPLPPPERLERQF
jgi:hypothetical protein